MQKTKQEINSLKIEANEKLKKSDAIKFLKEISSILTKEELIDFSNVVMLEAYRKGRVKAVEYLLSFYNENEPKLLMIIHLQKMMSDKHYLISAKENQILKILLNNFSTDICINILNNYVEVNKDQKTKEHQQQLLTMILEEKLPKTNNVKRQKL